MRRSAIAASISVALLVIFFILFVGCAGKPLPVGTFRGEHRLAIRAGTDPAVADQVQRITLKIGEDGKANLEDEGMPWEGQVSRDGDKLDFEVLAVAGVNIEKNPSDLPRKLEFAVLPNGNLEYDHVELVRRS